MRVSVGRVLRATVMVCWTACLAGGAEAQELSWAHKMFSELRHDFGTVPRGADVRHSIAVKNVYQETVRIVNVGTTCGCTAAKPSQEVLKTGETAYVEVVMNTVKFSRQKDSNVDVTLSFTDARGLSSTKAVRIPISAYIRPDVVLEPGGVNFGSLDAGTGGERRITVSYAGRGDWHVRDVQVNSPYLQAEVVQTHRAPAASGDTTVRYDLIVKVQPNAPLGNIRDRLTLVTNDVANPQIPLLVEARIEPDIVVSPGTLPLGDIVPGSERTYTVIIKGKKPFAIEKIECESDHECFKVRLSQDAKTVHVLPLTFIPPEVSGEFREQFTVTIAGRPEPLTFSATGKILTSVTSTAPGT
jgi:hypothetical protein